MIYDDFIFNVYYYYFFFYILENNSYYGINHGLIIIDEFSFQLFIVFRLGKITKSNYYDIFDRKLFVFRLCINYT